MSASDLQLRMLLTFLKTIKAEVYEDRLRAWFLG